MVKLGVNIDHVATLRQARRGREPDPVWAAVEAQLGGADGITMHLREDRRHIQERDVFAVQAVTEVKLNLEMAATEAMATLAERLRPHMAMLVPEGREEVTTEGGLDVAGDLARIREVVARLAGAGMRVSAFIDPEPGQVEAAARAGFDVCEVHTGPYAQAFAEKAGDLSAPALGDALEIVGQTGRRIVDAGMGFNAGHGLNHANVGPVSGLAGLQELHIGHAIVSRAIFVGMRASVAGMKAAFT